MIIPMVCFSCGKPISHLWEDYLSLVKNYEIESEAESTKKNKKSSESKTPEFKALADLKIGRECCRRMFFCQQDMYQKVR